MTQQITYDGLLSLMKDKYTEITGVKPEDSGDIEIRMKLLAGELFSLYSRIAGLESRIFPDTAVGIDLERHGAQRGIYRKTASTASGEIDFIIDEKAEFDIVIPEKTVCAIAAEDVCQYVTTKEAVLTAGETKVTVPAEATIEGRDGNCAAEKITIMITPPVGIDRVINPSPFTGGGNSESDEALRKRILESWSSIPNGSNPITYTEIALTFEDVLKAKTVPVNRGAGTVDVIIVAKDGKYDIDLERAIYIKLKSYCPAGIDLKVKEAEQYGVSLSLLVKVKDNLDEENTIEICRERIEDFFSDLQIGEEIRLCDLGKVLMEIDGIVNYRFLTPESDITPPADCEITLSDLTISGRFE